MMAGSTERPLLFLDIDGTLIPLGHAGRDPAPGVEGIVPAATPSGNPLLARLDSGHGPRLRTLGCELVWATSWMDDANIEISPRLDLPMLPVVDWPEDAENAVTGRLHWKTKPLVAWAAGRAFVWVDDEITEADRVWVASRHDGDALLHRVEPSLGLTDTDIAAIQQWLDLRQRLVVPVGELARRVQVLLDELCIGLGLCLPPAEQERLRTAPPMDPDEFVEAVFAAEGLDASPHGRLRRQVRERVVRRLPDIVSAYR